MKKQAKDKLEDVVLDPFEQEIEDSITDSFIFKSSAKDVESFAAIAKAHQQFSKSKRTDLL